MRLKYLTSFLFVLTVTLALLGGRAVFTSSSPSAHAAQRTEHIGPTKNNSPILPLPLSGVRHVAPLIPTNAAWSIMPTTTSLYEATTDAVTMYNQGCSAAKQASGLLVLDWGQPVYMGNGLYGTYDFGGHDDSDSAILHAVANFVQGVWYCRTSSTNLAIAIGESNYYSGYALPLTNAAWYADGQQWGKLINNLASFVSDNHYNNIGIYGAGDLETEWNSFTLTKSMVDGYNNTSSRIFFDFGDDSPGYWTNWQVWYVAYGARDNMPLPEIYFDADATYDWQVLNRWACANEGGPMYIRGVMATFIGNTPAQAWSAMSRATAGDSCTARTLPWMNFSTYMV